MIAFSYVNSDVQFEEVNRSHICKFSYVECAKEEMVRSYVRSAVATNSTYQNTKWVPWPGRFGLQCLRLEI